MRPKRRGEPHSTTLPRLPSAWQAPDRSPERRLLRSRGQRPRNNPVTKNQPWKGCSSVIRLSRLKCP